jgi:Ca-activated chloride channel family protein
MQGMSGFTITSDYGVAKMFLQSMNTDIVSSRGTSLMRL